jgi:hypothetical protein
MWGWLATPSGWTPARGTLVVWSIYLALNTVAAIFRIVSDLS